MIQRSTKLIKSFKGDKLQYNMFCKNKINWNLNNIINTIILYFHSKWNLLLNFGNQIFSRFEIKTKLVMGYFLY